MNRAISTRLPLTSFSKQCSMRLASTATTTKKIVLHNHPSTSLASFNNKLAKLVRMRKGNARNVLSKVLEITNEIKAQNLSYDLNTYNALLAAYARAHDKSKIDKTINQMEKEGIKPTTDSYNLILEAYANHRDVEVQLDWKKEMEQKGIEFNNISYYHLLRGQRNYRLALETFNEMKQRGLTPTLSSYTLLIQNCPTEQSKKAFELLKEVEESGMPIASEPSLYFHMMRLAASTYELDVTSYCWKKAVNELSLRPDEGTCIGVLNVAARKGDTSLATDVIRQLSKNGYPYKEHYFTPLMEAFVVKDDLKSAFNVLDIMRISGVPPTMKSVYNLRKRLSTSTAMIDKAYFTLEEMKKEKKPIDIVAFNVVVAACADAGDVVRTIGTYREAAKLGITPDIDTYNAILDVCINGRVEDMDNVVITEMKNANVTPNVDTYVKMIEICSRRKDFEQAFQYLEQMKDYNTLPPERCYFTLAYNLSNRNDPRYHLVLEEMETLGYDATKVKRFMTKDSEERQNREGRYNKEGRYIRESK
ncbi:hypothetical protein BCV72DRAFT_303517 [Rhizopus microsporus var. microsporus]|uniref:Pentatricopeptide repeat-containing protein-mitochondrial domain-containing protein n=2 Tax=Rhizopus microsporus TaxID=58291 RepID=A0A2G4T8Z0_RHIZD|nr:uncharacterized protein RHIMIDRAFT_232911 [Rhizopus microsporus ATCC 52813]ORE08709.1 hypothetical protein BCV72DRAFT_303517 [Rhizopus microsporus var. microsporus]PHZ17481.1 hypothetical protein RHIMIDRAFT_232911 [Rhizopus microsporus ATCC 52813]